MVMQSGIPPLFVIISLIPLASGRFVFPLSQHSKAILAASLAESDAALYSRRYCRSLELTKSAIISSSGVQRVKMFFRFSSAPICFSLPYIM